jgi:ATP-dependent RNA helicase DDX35
MVKSRKLLPLPLFAGLTHEEQIQAFDRTPSNVRKVIVATNIAETSVTIEGIDFVIDCGLVKVVYHLAFISR